MLYKGFGENILKKGHKMHSGYLESKMSFRVKRAPSLDKFENTCRKGKSLNALT